MKLLGVLLVLGVFGLSSVRSQKVSAVLYSNPGYEDEDPHRTFLTFPSPNTNYSCMPNSLQPASVCVNHGFFIAYEGADFTDYSYIVKGDNCTDFPAGVAKNIQSFRMAGAHDKKDTISFFTGLKLEGSAISAMEESADLADGAIYLSFVINGDSSWRFYMNRNFTGLNLCWDPATHSISDGVFDNWGKLDGLEPGDVRSFRKGC